MVYYFKRVARTKSWSQSDQPNGEFRCHGECDITCFTLIKT
jgi:hypothetical protein